MKCQNCGASHGCGCQARTASDGTQCCSACIQQYEMTKKSNQNIVTIGQPSPNNHKGTAPTITSIVYNKFN